ncbi:MAG: InlB B-repeat-containing protein [Clostridia bacterium]|nr:InlB B-repeat-containing protein [Clostridia bacterium]
MKKLAVLLCLVTALCMLFACGGNADGKGGENAEYTPLELYARFMTNVSGEEVNLTTGYYAVGDNLLFSSQKITAGQKISAPTDVPERKGFVFDGWATDIEGTELFDFDEPVYGGVTLYAKWVRDESGQQDEYEEPSLSFTEKKDESSDINVFGVLNSFVEENTVKLTRAAIRLLEENADNVKELLNYTVNSATTVKSATYAGMRVTVTYDNGEDEGEINIDVTDASAEFAVTDNDTYQNKAVKYENNVNLPPYSVIMAGSSSMENWATSVEDMQPVTTANVGIGGTTVEHWSEKLAQRLIYPFNPRAVILYVGINNIINNGKDGEQTGNALVTLFDDIHLHLPEAHIYFIMINKVPGFRNYYGEIDVANGIVTEYAENAAHAEYITLIDAGSVLVKKSGITNKAYFLSDGLHMSLCGYVLWGKEVKNAFIATERELYFK